MSNFQPTNEIWRNGFDAGLQVRRNLNKSSGGESGGGSGGASGIFNGECTWKCAKEINLEATVSYSGYNFKQDAVIDAYAIMYAQYGFPYTVSHDETVADDGTVTRVSKITTWFDNIRHDKCLTCTYNPTLPNFQYPVSRQDSVHSAMFYGNATSAFCFTNFFNSANATETEDSVTMRLGVIDGGGIFVPAIGLGAKNGMRAIYYPNAHVVVTDNGSVASDGSQRSISFTSSTIYQYGGSYVRRMCSVDPSVVSDEDKKMYGVDIPKIDGVESRDWFPLTRINGDGFTTTNGIWIKPLNEDTVYYAQIYTFGMCPHACILGSTTPDAIDFYNLA